MVGRIKGQRGFTLIELMIVVAIIGILAAIAIPNMLNYQAKSMQAEAKTNLGVIYTGMIVYGGNNSTYVGATLSTADFTTSGTPRYSYTLSNLAVETFLATATGISSRVAGDVWTIDQTKTITDVDPTSFSS